jgi:signal transduction histidine kinase
MGRRSSDRDCTSNWRQQALEIWKRMESGQWPVVGPPDLPAVSLEGELLADLLAMATTHASLTERFGESLAEARLEATRELAYGAGHEINNPLANIATRAQSLLLEERDPERRKRLATIVDQSFRARDLIGGMMLFARPPKPHPAVVDVSLMVAAVIDSLALGAASRSIRLEYSPPPVPLPVVVDRAQIEEAIRMVVVNAVEAVADGGRVTLQASSRQEQGREWCAITIDDDGRGMDRQTVQRAFDPFFSGREAGRGVGLGLSKAWGFVTGAGGIIRIDSRPAQGTCVTILVPVG